MIRSISFGLIVLVGISFGITGCGEWKPLDHSISKHGQHHHGAGSKAHKNGHPND